jgi:hypothetical protein
VSQAMAWVLAISSALNQKVYTRFLVTHHTTLELRSVSIQFQGIRNFMTCVYCRRLIRGIREIYTLTVSFVSFSELVTFVDTG